MGSRARRKGVTNAALKAARAAATAEERRAMQIAADIFSVAMEEHRDAGDTLPLEMRAPLSYLGLRCAPHMLKRAELEATPENVAAVIEYLTQGFCSMFVEFDFDHFRKWQTQTNALAVLAGNCAVCGKPAGEHAVRDGLRWCEDGTLAAFEEVRLDDEEPVSAGETEEVERDVKDEDRG